MATVTLLITEEAMHHDPLTLYEIDMHIRRAHELRASYIAEFPGKFFQALKSRSASRLLMVAAIAAAVSGLGVFVAVASTH